MRTMLPPRRRDDGPEPSGAPRLHHSDLEAAGTRVAESVFATIKVELVLRQKFATRAAARAALFEHMEAFYNRNRLHSTVGHQTPVDFEK